MSGQFIFISCCLFTLLLGGCNGASSKVDVGPTYKAPAGTGPQTIDGVTYEYPATPERQQAIISGYPQLKLGQTREEVRALVGAPDYAVAMHRRGSDRFEGWQYLYYGHRLHLWTDANDQWVQIFFDRSSERLYYAYANALPGFTAIGAQRE
jgi:hypothetical protein